VQLVRVVGDVNFPLADQLPVVALRTAVYMSNWSEVRRLSAFVPGLSKATFGARRTVADPGLIHALRLSLD